MTDRKRGSAISRIIDVLGSAIVVAAAVESGRKPFDRDLNALGIDPRQFRDIRRF